MQTNANKQEHWIQFQRPVAAMHPVAPSDPLPPLPGLTQLPPPSFRGSTEIALTCNSFKTFIMIRLVVTDETATPPNLMATFTLSCRTTLVHADPKTNKEINQRELFKKKQG